jgi:HPt (histidine-containing phosphotransfer) domain-containing protein
MLEVDPKRRATLPEILNDKWVINSQVCSQEEGGRVINMDNHAHTLEGSATATSAPPSKK